MRKIFVLFVVLFHINNMFSQSNSDRELLYHRIEMRDSLLERTHIKKKTIMTDTLKAQLKDYQSLMKLQEKEQTELAEELEKTEKERKRLQEEKESLAKAKEHFERITDNSPNVFTDKPFDSENVPTCLLTHTTLVNHIIDIRKGIEKIEKTIEEAKRANKNKKAINKSIEKDVWKLDNMFIVYEKADKSSFSESQISYIRELANRYNNFLIYFQ